MLGVNIILKNAAYTIAVYLITQTTVLFFFSVWIPWGNPDLTKKQRFQIVRVRLIENIPINYLISDGKLIRKRKMIKIFKNSGSYFRGFFGICSVWNEKLSDE
ncbi:hypothetical protein [Listeria monocytogenes]|uniref:hypothetical protein n=1 Tax=Listeria monocytogenes TaxID=1639 RepID=UPI0002593B10|nr:hypothetical protein [Listeria monocytogenes]AFH81247.1 hypothetical protein MUO_13655 [Listeria monocytogenes 07PF0776]